MTRSYFVVNHASRLRNVGFWRSSQQEVADQLEWLHEGKSFAGSVVELLGHPVEVFAAVHTQVGALWEILPRQAIGRSYVCQAAVSVACARAEDSMIR
jgi:hypothetical protein